MFLWNSKFFTCLFYNLYSGKLKAIKMSSSKVTLNSSYTRALAWQGFAEARAFFLPIYFGLRYEIIIK